MKIGRAVGRGGRELGKTRDAVDRRFGTWFSIAWKLAVFYVLWISASYLGMWHFTTDQARQIAAIGYWFGWGFLALTVTFGVVVTLNGVVDQLRLTRRDRHQ